MTTYRWYKCFRWRRNSFCHVLTDEILMAVILMCIGKAQYLNGCGLVIFEVLPVSFHWCEFHCLFMSQICLFLCKRECPCVEMLLLCRCCETHCVSREMPLEFKHGKKRSYSKKIIIILLYRNLTDSHIELCKSQLHWSDILTCHGWTYGAVILKILTY